MTKKEEIDNEKDWKNKCRLILLFHVTQVLHHGKKRPNKWRLKDTAEALDYSLGFISESIVLAKGLPKLHLDLCRTREEALEVYYSRRRDDEG